MASVFTTYAERRKDWISFWLQRILFQHSSFHLTTIERIVWRSTGFFQRVILSVIFHFFFPLHWRSFWVHRCLFYHLLAVFVGTVDSRTSSLPSQNGCFLHAWVRLIAFSSRLVIFLHCNAAMLKQDKKLF